MPPRRDGRIEAVDVRSGDTTTLLTPHDALAGDVGSVEVAAALLGAPLVTGRRPEDPGDPRSRAASYAGAAGVTGVAVVVLGLLLLASVRRSRRR